MTQAEIEAFVTRLPNVQRVENFGYAFFFVGDAHRLPFVTIASSDNEFDAVSNLDREGVFRTNIGISKATFDDLLDRSDPEGIDYSLQTSFCRTPTMRVRNLSASSTPTATTPRRRSD